MCKLWTTEHDCWCFVTPSIKALWGYNILFTCKSYFSSTNDRAEKENHLDDPELAAMKKRNGFDVKSLEEKKFNQLYIIQCFI